MGRTARDYAREVYKLILMHVYVALPTLVGAWSMALLQYTVLQTKNTVYKSFHDMKGDVA